VYSQSECHHPARFMGITSARYADMMQRFVNDLNLSALFGGYWKEYVSQLPETVFQQVNENFYSIIKFFS
jgi:hypothetical protein